MSLLFVCDNIFFVQQDKVYSNSFPYSFFQQYLKIFKKITVVARANFVVDVKDLPLAEGEGIEFIFFENISTFSSFFGLRQKHKKRLRTIMIHHDRLIVRLPGELGVLAADIAQEYGMKLMVEVVGSAWDAMWYYGGMKAKLYAPYFAYRVKEAVKKADFIHYVTQNYLQKKYPAAKNARTIGVSDVSLPQMDEHILKKRMSRIQTPSYPIKFGMIANLDMKYKGIEVALKMFASLQKFYPNIEYQIVGEGDPSQYYDLAKNLRIGQCFVIKGKITNREKLFEWLDQIDIYLQPSLTEGMPRSVIEAMSRGCPVVASSVGGIPELLDAAVLFPSQNIQVFEQHVKNLILDKDFMFSQAKRNFQKAKAYEKSKLRAKFVVFLYHFKEA